MRVLFASGIDGFCHRYQVLHRAAQLERLGVASAALHFTDPRLASAAVGCDVLFLYRVPETACVRAAVAAARRAGAAIVGAIDDLIFLPDPAIFPGLEARDPAERALWLDGVRRYRATLELCDAFLAPTQPLLDEARRLGWRAYLHRNAISDAELALGDAAAGRARAEAGPAAAAGRAGAERTVALGYFAGTPTHDGDFAMVAPVLAALLREVPAARLVLAGPVEPGPEIAALGGRVERPPFVAWSDLPELVARVDVSLAPLELGWRFAAAKGEIKYLEAASVGVPLVASPSAAFSYAIRDGENGRLASSPEGWARALRDLVADPASRVRLGAAARVDLERRWREASRARELAAILDEVCPGRARRAASGVVCVSPGPAGEAEVPDPPSVAQPRCVSGSADEPRLARLALEPDARPAAGALEPAGVSPPLLPGTRVAQRFRVRHDGLCRVDVHTVTYGLSPRQGLELALRRDDGTLAARAAEAAADAPDRGWLALELSPEPRSAGRWYTLEIAATGDDPRDAPSVSLAPPTGDAPAAERAGCSLGGALVLRAFAAWRYSLPHPGAARAGAAAGCRAAGRGR